MSSLKPRPGPSPSVLATAPACAVDNVARAEAGSGTDQLTLATLLRLALEAIVRESHARLAREGFGDLRPAQTVIFQHLRPEGSRIGDLAERAQLTNQSIGYLVDALEQRGYVERRPDPRDRRAARVCFTPRGWEAFRACERVRRQVEVEWAQRIGPESFQQLRALLLPLAETRAHR